MTTTGRTSKPSAWLLGVIFGLGACLAAGVAPARAADEKPKVEMETSAGKIVLELEPEKAPLTVENFLKYVDEGFYDDLIFHRVIRDFMIQGGGFDDKLREKSKGTRGPVKNESRGGLPNKRGTIAMARTPNPDSATNQFFINHKDNPFLDFTGGNGGYTVFGTVIEGMDVVDAIAATQTSSRGGMADVPVKPIYIKSVKRVKK